MDRLWFQFFIGLATACAANGSFTTQNGDAGASGGTAGAGATANTGGAGTGGSNGGASGTAGTGGSNGGAGGSNTGGANSGGGQSSGGSAMGGASGAAGFAGCGPCPGYACPPSAVMLFVQAPNGGVIGSLTVDSPGAGMDCARNGCGFVCRSTETKLPDGSYQVTLKAPGYGAKLVPFTITNPTQCGCCGCCPGAFQQNVTLEPDGSPITGCCSDLQTDPMNCGTCGHACTAGASCSAGQCQPALGPCLGPTSGFLSCNAYCASLGRACVPACGVTHDQSLNWWSTPGCSESVVYSTGGTCSDAFYWASAQGYRCCCSGS